MNVPFDADGIATALVRDGWWVDAAALDPSLCAALLADLHAVDAGAGLTAAGIGRGANYRHDQSIRGDRIGWLTATTLPQRTFLDILDSLRHGLNRSLFLGLAESEAHFAQYETGTRYQRHVDTFIGTTSRVISLIAYLNADWDAADGGELVLYTAHATAELARVVPRAGTIVAFMSDTITHEVLPARRSRASIAAWLRRRECHLVPGTRCPP
jgi:SM-20-related protein